MKRIILVLFVIAAPALWALDVVTGELESAKDRNVVFVSYEGPPAKVESLAAIKGIGSDLGAAARAGAARAGVETRYAVIRVVDPAAAQGFDADILVLGADAQVDHIRNLRWIIAGYLGSAWGYSEKDAFLLATFVTIYNAVHRGDMAYIGTKYKAAVLKELSPANAGLATTYTEWPGKTRILIPLTAGARPGSLGAVSTGAVSDKAVTENLQAEPGKAIPDRQSMTDLKEREAAQKQAEVDAQKAAVAKQEAALAAEKAKVEADRAKLDADKAAAAAAPPAAAAPAAAGPAAAGAPPAPAAAPGQGQSAELTKREAEVAAAEKAVAQKETAVAAAKEEVKQGEAAVAAKKEEAAQDRAAITQDQKAVIAAEVAAKGASEKPGVFFFRIVEDSFHLAQIVYVDPEGGTMIRSSRINSLHPRSIVDAGDGFVAVAGREGAAGGVRLMKLDKTSLEDVADGQTEMFADSPVWKIGTGLFAVAKGDAGTYYLARFGADLKEAARSKLGVNPYTMLVEGGGGLIAQTPSGSLAVLNADSLQTVKEMKP